jgi:hypothetical protein
MKANSLLVSATTWLFRDLLKHPSELQQAASGGRTRHSVSLSISACWFPATWSDITRLVLDSVSNLRAVGSDPTARREHWGRLKGKKLLDISEK